MEQILINLVAGALGGVGVGKSSPTFDLGMIGNVISGWSEVAARSDRYAIAAVHCGRSGVGQSEC